MSAELFIPKLGQTVDEVTLLNWLVKDGDKVEQGQEVLEVETDKAVFNIEAPADGYIHIGPYQPSQVVPVLTVVAIIGGADEKFELKNFQPQMDKKPQATMPSQISQPSELQQMQKSTGTDKLFASPRARKLAAHKGIDLNLATPTGGGGVRVREQDVINFLSQTPKVSPLAKILAQEAGLDLRSVIPTGTRGEITRADVELALALRSRDLKTAIQPEQPPMPPLEIKERLPLKGVRGLIAERMGKSARESARVTLFMDVDATDFVQVREDLKKRYEPEWGFAPGFNELLVRVCSLSLLQYPYMNARLNGEAVELLAEINIGIAVDAENGLYVPVIRNADKKDLHAIGSEFRQRVEEIRSGKIAPDHLSGGTFTITNLGMYDVEGFTPIINLPEAAILGVGRIMPKPVAREGEVVIRNMLTLSLVFDHRLINGAPAARFMQSLKHSIEMPDKDLLMG